MHLSSIFRLNRLFFTLHLHKPQQPHHFKQHKPQTTTLRLLSWPLGCLPLRVLAGNCHISIYANKHCSHIPSWVSIIICPSSVESSPILCCIDHWPPEATWGHLSRSWMRKEAIEFDIPLGRQNFHRELNVNIYLSVCVCVLSNLWGFWHFMHKSFIELCANINFSFI